MTDTIIMQRIAPHNYVLMYGRELFASLESKHGDDPKVQETTDKRGVLTFVDGHTEPCDIAGFSERKSSTMQKKNFKRYQKT